MERNIIFNYGYYRLVLLGIFLINSCNDSQTQNRESNVLSLSQDECIGENLIWCGERCNELSENELFAVCSSEGEVIIRECKSSTLLCDNECFSCNDNGESYSCSENLENKCIIESCEGGYKLEKGQCIFMTNEELQCNDDEDKEWCDNSCINKPPNSQSVECVGGELKIIDCTFPYYNCDNSCKLCDENSVSVTCSQFNQCIPQECNVGFLLIDGECKEDIFEISENQCRVLYDTISYCLLEKVFGSVSFGGSGTICENSTEESYENFAAKFCFNFENPMTLDTYNRELEKPCISHASFMCAYSDDLFSGCSCGALNCNILNDQLCQPVLDSTNLELVCAQYTERPDLPNAQITTEGLNTCNSNEDCSFISSCVRVNDDPISYCFKKCIVNN